MKKYHNEITSICIAENDVFRNYDDYIFSENELLNDDDESDDDEDVDTSNDEIDDVQNTESNTSEPGKIYTRSYSISIHLCT